MVSALALAFDVRPVKSDHVWTETIYIRADGTIQPPTAPTSSVDNVTYTFTDNITGNVPMNSSAIIIQRDNITIDGAGYILQDTQASGSIGIDLTGRSNVTIENMEITAFARAISFLMKHYLCLAETSKCGYRSPLAVEPDDRVLPACFSEGNSETA